MTAKPIPLPGGTTRNDKFVWACPSLKLRGRDRRHEIARALRDAGATAEKPVVVQMQVLLHDTQLRSLGWVQDGLGGIGTVVPQVVEGYIEPVQAPKPRPGQAGWYQWDASHLVQQAERYTEFITDPEVLDAVARSARLLLGAVNGRRGQLLEAARLALSDKDTTRSTPGS